jgi:hypothetical protein
MRLSPFLPDVQADFGAGFREGGVTAFLSISWKSVRVNRGACSFDFLPNLAFFVCGFMRTPIITPLLLSANAG